MSNPQHLPEHHYNTYAPQPQPEKPQKKRWPWLIVIPAVGFLMLASCGTGGALMAGETVTEEIEVPGPTQTVTPEPEIITETETITEEVEVEVEVTPEECSDALNSAEEIYDIYSEGLAISADIMGSFDVGYIEMKTRELEDLTVELENALFTYHSYALSCNA